MPFYTVFMIYVILGSAVNMYVTRRSKRISHRELKEV